MKKIATLIAECKMREFVIVCLVVGLALAGTLTSVSASTLLATVDLLAGQDIPVGTVTIEDNGGTLKVLYEITDTDWCLQAVHADVANTIQDIPQTRSGNPKVGKFDHNVKLNCVSSYTAVLGNTPGGGFVVAAHAVVDTTSLCQSEGIIYGVERGDGKGDLWAIDLVNGTQTLVKNFTDPSTSVNWPNGLAFDANNEVLYFSVGSDGPPSELWKYDFPSGNVSGPLAVNGGTTLQGVSAGATFSGTDYLYFKNGTDDLQNVDVSGIAATETPRQGDVTSNTSALRFGDIALVPGTTKVVGSPGGMFFELDIDNGDFSVKCTTDVDCAAGLQVAFGSNGVLYAHDAGSGKYWAVDPSDGIKETTAPIQILKQMTDLASGAQCVPDKETAWGDGGMDFFGSNWATYIFIDQT